MKTVVNLHPEELIERDARGELTASERLRLDAHLAQCEACRFELALRDDFASELAAEVTPSETLSLAGVSQPRAPSTPRAPSVPPPAPEPPALPARLPRRRSPRVAWLLVAAAVLAVSAASATGAARHVWAQIVSPAEATTVAGAPATSPASARTRQRVWKSGEAAVVVAPVADPRSIETALAPPPPAAPAAARPRPVEGASAVFDASNQARRRGDYERALVLARDLQARFPASREAHVARATTARLLLDRGDPAGALADFDAYLAHGSGDLGEEAMVGRATALERLGRTGDAGRAWQALLAAYPDSPYAAHAQARLGSLSVR
ncbi:MAG TPA: tetratricopeptide repeat protein [Polyangiaceae bacterium]